MLIDLSHTIEDGMITYQGLPAPHICDFLSREDSREHYSPGVSFQIGKIEMVANTGTYIDVPFHRYEEGADLSEVGLNQLVGLTGEFVKIDGDVRAIGPEWFEGLEIKGKALLIQTDWDRHWRTDRYYSGEHPFVTAEGAELLLQLAPRLVGIDTYNIDDTGDPARPVHSLLLGAGILIIEHMTNLASIPAGPFTFTALPPKIRGMGSFPVRAYASV